MKLSRRAGRDISVPEAETREIKTALARLGLYEIPSYGLTPYPDEAMFDGIAALQTRLGAEATGSMLPGGIEELAMSDALSHARSGNGSASSPGSVHVRAYKQTRHGDEVQVAEHDRSLPGSGAPSKRIVAPTLEGKIRGKDRWGDGGFGSSRTRKDNTQSTHQGTDFVSQPGERILSPISGTITRTDVDPYGDGRYSGVIIRDDEGNETKILYIDPKLPPGSRVEAGENIGTAQDLSSKYPGITNHVHIEFWHGRARYGTPYTPYAPSK